MVLLGLDSGEADESTELWRHPSPPPPSIINKWASYHLKIGYTGQKIPRELRSYTVGSSTVAEECSSFQKIEKHFKKCFQCLTPPIVSNDKFMVLKINWNIFCRKKIKNKTNTGKQGQKRLKKVQFFVIFWKLRSKVLERVNGYEWKERKDEQTDWQRRQRKRR